MRDTSIQKALSKTPMTVTRSLLFNIAFFTWTTVCCFGLLWMLLLPRRQMVHVVEWYLRTVYFLERAILGLDYEVRGLENVPRNGSYILAAKHQSAWETMKLHLLIDDPAIILKRELLFLPIWGWYAAKARMIAVDRSARGRAIGSMIEGAARVKSEGRPIVIFPGNPDGRRTLPALPGRSRGALQGTGPAHRAHGVEFRRLLGPTQFPEAERPGPGGVPSADRAGTGTGRGAGGTGNQAGGGDRSAGGGSGRPAYGEAGQAGAPRSAGSSALTFSPCGKLCGCARWRCTAKRLACNTGRLSGLRRI